MVASPEVPKRKTTNFGRRFRPRAATLAFFSPAESRDLARGIIKTYLKVPKLVRSSELELLEVELFSENPCKSMKIHARNDYFIGFPWIPVHPSRGWQMASQNRMVHQRWVDFWLLEDSGNVCTSFPYHKCHRRQCFTNQKWSEAPRIAH